jgi:hypothetical protein
MGGWGGCVKVRQLISRAHVKGRSTATAMCRASNRCLQAVPNTIIVYPASGLDKGSPVVRLDILPGTVGGFKADLIHLYMLIWPICDVFQAVVLPPRGPCPAVHSISSSNAPGPPPNRIPSITYERLYYSAASHLRLSYMPSPLPADHLTPNKSQTLSD